MPSFMASASSRQGDLAAFRHVPSPKHGEQVGGIWGRAMYTVFEEHAFLSGLCSGKG